MFDHSGRRAEGVFTYLRGGPDCYGVEKQGHDVFIKDGVSSSHPVLIQIVAPHKIAPAVLEMLSRHGVMRSTIYPAIDYVHADLTDLDRAAALRGMRWLQEPEKNYLPQGSTLLPFAITEDQRNAVEKCCEPEEGFYRAAFRLFVQGLKAELAAKGRTPNSKRTRKRTP